MFSTVLSAGGVQQVILLQEISLPARDTCCPFKADPLPLICQITVVGLDFNTLDASEDKPWYTVGVIFSSEQ